MKRKLLSLALILSNSVSAQTLTPETLWKLGRVSDPQISPDGSKVIYNVRKFDLQKNKGNSDIYLYDFKNNSSVVIAGDSSNETQARWNKVNNRIYYLSDGGDQQALFSMNSDGSDKRKESRFSGDINEYGFSDNFMSFWFTQNVQLDKFNGRDKYADLPKTSGRVYDDLMMRHWDSWKDGSYSHVFYVPIINAKIDGTPKDIMANEHFDSPLKPNGGDEEISLSADGKLLAYTCKKYSGAEYAINTNSDIYVYNIGNGQTENVSEFNPGYDKAPVFSPDGKYLAWISFEEAGNEASLQRICVCDLQNNTHRFVTEGFEYNAEHLAWSEDSKSIYFIADINATDQLFSVNIFPVKGNKAFRQITNDLVDYQSFSIASVGKAEKIVASRMSISQPTEIFSIDLKTGLASQLTYTNKDVLSTFKMGKVEKRMINSSDGKQILTWVIYPPDFDSSKKYPALLYCQGGPQSTVSQFFSYRWNFQLMAANGYIVVAPNRRGLPGFGKAWNDEISGDWGGQAMRDLLSSIDSVAKEPYVNKDRLGAVGASYGGYSVFWLAGNHNKRFKAFISHCGVYNLESMLGTEELFFYNHENDGYYWQNPKPKTYDAFSPHKFVQNWDTPILIISNEKDYRIPYSQGLEAYSAARVKGIPARFLSFPDEGHWVLKPQNSIMWQREFYDWLDGYLKR